MNKLLLASLFSISAITAAEIPEETPRMGIVNFFSCLGESKYGKHEQSSLESAVKQMKSLVEDTEKQAIEVSKKLEDKDFRDGLSPEAEQALKVKFQTLREELGRYQQQYYNFVNQAQMKMYQSVNSQVSEASEKVATQKKLSAIISKDQVFFNAPSLDVTDEVIKEMDKKYEADPKMKAAKAPESK